MNGDPERAVVVRAALLYQFIGRTRFAFLLIVFLDKRFEILCTFVLLHFTYLWHNERTDKLFCSFIPAVQIEGTDYSFNCVCKNCTFLSPAGHFFALAKHEICINVHLLFCNGTKDRFAYY